MDRQAQNDSRILTINSGSSSIKFALFQDAAMLCLALEGSIQRIGLKDATFAFRDTLHDQHGTRSIDAMSFRSAVAFVIPWLACDRQQGISSFAAALGGLDTLVFAGGIGENASVIRSRICDELRFLKLEIDENSKSANADLISTTSSGVKVRVIRTNEQLMIARHVHDLIGTKCVV